MFEQLRIHLPSWLSQHTAKGPFQALRQNRIFWGASENLGGQKKFGGQSNLFTYEMHEILLKMMFN